MDHPRSLHRFFTLRGAPSGSLSDLLLSIYYSPKRSESLSLTTSNGSEAKNYGLKMFNETLTGIWKEDC